MFKYMNNGKHIKYSVTAIIICQLKISKCSIDRLYLLLLLERVLLFNNFYWLVVIFLDILPSKINGYFFLNYDYVCYKNVHFTVIYLLLCIFRHTSIKTLETLHT